MVVKAAFVIIIRILCMRRRMTERRVSFLAKYKTLHTLGECWNAELADQADSRCLDLISTYSVQNLTSSILTSPIYNHIFLSEQLAPPKNQEGKFW